MHEATQKVAAFIEGHSEQSFLADEKTQSAVVPGLEIIGETAKKVSSQTRSRRATTPWREVIVMRDVVIHDYFGVKAQVSGTLQPSMCPDSTDPPGPFFRPNLHAPARAQRVRGRY